jgi:hypothetical protein
MLGLLREEIPAGECLRELRPPECDARAQYPQATALPAADRRYLQHTRQRVLIDITGWRVFLTCSWRVRDTQTAGTCDRSSLRRIVSPRTHVVFVFDFLVPSLKSGTSVGTLNGPGHRHSKARRSRLVSPPHAHNLLMDHR